MCLTTIFLLSVYTIYYYYNYSKRKNPLPGPLPLPFIGNLYHFEFFWKNGKEQISNKFIDELFSRYGDIFETYSFNERIIWINRIDLAERFLSTDSDKDSKDHHFHLRNKNEIKELRINEMGIHYNHEYDSWKFHRNVLTKSVTSPKFLKEVVMELQEQFKELENYWNDMESPIESEPKGSNDSNSPQNGGNKTKEHTPSIHREDRIIDISKWMNSFTLDILLQSITRRKSFSMANYFNQITRDEENQLKGIEPLLDESNLFINKFRNSSWLLYQLNFILIGLPNPFKKFFQVYKLYNRKYFKDYWWLHETLLDIVRARRSEIPSPKEQDLKADMLTSLINFGTSSGNERALTDEEIVFITKDIISGGIETISNSFSYIIYYICKNPIIKYRMIEEIDSILGSHHNEPFTYFRIDKLYYCEAVIKEVSRIHPVYPIISRVLGKKVKMGGFTWDVGQTFYINLHAIHKHKYNWNNPEEFNPERYLYLEKDEDEKELNEKEPLLIREEPKENPLFPFGMGLRSCPAKDLAMIMLKTMVVMFLRKYDVILMEKDLKLQIHYSNMLNSCEELRVKIRPRHH